MDLTTSARVKSWLEGGGVSAGTANDALISALIKAYSTLAEVYMGRETLAAERTDTLDVEEGQRVFFLRAWPVTDFESATDASDRDFDSALPIDTTDYVVDLERGVVEFDQYQPVAGRRTLQVVYTGGMALDTTAFIAAYPDVATALDMQIAYTLSRRDQLGAQNLSTQAGNIAWSGPIDWLPQAKQIMDLHRRLL